MKNIKFTNKSAVMLALLTAVSGSVCAVERTADTAEQNAGETMYRAAGKTDSMIKDDISSAIDKNDELYLKTIIHTMAKYKYGMHNCEDFAFFYVCEKPNKDKLEYILSLPYIVKGIKPRTFAVCLNNALGSHDKSLLDSLSDEKNFQHIHRNFVDRVVVKNIVMSRYSSDWLFKDILDFISDRLPVKPTEKGINRCFEEALDNLVSPWEIKRLDNVHASIKTLFDKYGKIVDQKIENDILNAYVQKLEANKVDHHNVLKMLAEVPFSEEAFKGSTALAEYLDRRPRFFSDKEFYELMAIRTKDGKNSSLAIYLIYRYLNGKRDVSPEAMNNVIKNSTKQNTGHLKQPAIGRVSKIPFDGKLVPDTMRLVRQYLGNPRIEDMDLYKRANDYRENQPVQIQPANDQAVDQNQPVPVQAVNDQAGGDIAINNGAEMDE